MYKINYYYMKDTDLWHPVYIYGSYNMLENNAGHL